MSRATTIAEWLTWAAAIPQLPRDLTTVNEDAAPDIPGDDYLLARHRADTDERYADRAWGEVA